MTGTARKVGGCVASAAAAVLLGWSACAAITWLRYGRRRHPAISDPLLDRFMPEYEVSEHHQIAVAAPAHITFAAAREMDPNRSVVVRSIFRGRELLMGAPHGRTPKGGIVQQTMELGWGILAEDPGREIVVGAVTQPWHADVQFRALPPAAFVAFDEPGYAKIVWTLAADPLGPAASIFRTETRVATTDVDSCRRLRLYWSIFSPGIWMIRSRTLGLVKFAAERQYQIIARAPNPVWWRRE